jgi:intracellular septation protein A
MLRFVLREFGPLIAFGLLAYAFDVKAAVVGAVVVVTAGGGWRLWRGIAFTRIYTLTSTLTVVFGVVDLCSAYPFMLQYEAVITNVATGIAVVAGARGDKPMIQELAEQRAGQPFPDRPDVRRFFELFTLAWAGYFFVKAAFYLWIGLIMPLAEAVAVRSLVGGISLGIMLVVSITQGPRLFALCHRLKLLPATAPHEAVSDPR